MKNDRIISIERWLTSHDNYISGLRICNYLYADQVAEIFVSFTYNENSSNEPLADFGVGGAHHSGS